MSRKSVSPINISQLEQIGYVVKDLQKSMEAMTSTFGIGPWSVYVYPASALRETTYMGREVRFGMQVARCKHGALELELIQPLEGRNIYTDFLKLRGDGIHHLGWLLVPDLARTIKDMEKAGFRCLQTGRTYRARFAYFDTTSALGTLLEGYQIDQSVNPCQPDRIWPDGAMPEAPFTIARLEQVCWAVRDMQQSVEAMCHGLGIGPWQIYASQSGFFRDMVYRGKKIDFNMDCARTKVGNMDLELIQPTTRDNSFTDFLKERGEGIHHLGWMVVPDVQKVVESMGKAGFPCPMSGRIPGIHIAYLDTTPVLGAMLEAFDLDKSAATPRQPDRVWPAGK